jgi:4'-phosphopantetheinyl transferase
MPNPERDKQMAMTAQWTMPSPTAVLADKEVHVWLAYLPAALMQLEALTSVLSSDERARAEKFHFVEHRARWQATRGILRILLGHYLEVSAKEIAFRYGALGKPALLHLASGGLHFNASHSGDYAVFAVTRAGETGVDIECVRPDMARRDEIARRYFAPGEQRELLALPEPERAGAFFTLWTRKEAFVKARGTGLFSGLEKFEIALNEPRVLSVADDDRDAQDWWMAELPSIPGYAGAVVVHTDSCTAKFWNWQPEQAAA